MVCILIALAPSGEAPSDQAMGNVPGFFPPSR